MSTTSASPSAAVGRGIGPDEPPRRRITLWPLWASLAGALGWIGTIVFDVRPPAETEAWKKGEDYLVTAADMSTLDVVTGRMGWTAGLASVAALLVFCACWRRSVESRYDSAAARVVTLGATATAGAALLGYAWKGALANYLGPESGLYDDEGLFIYYILTDFGAYLPWFGVLVSAFAVVWMAFAERLVSRVLGAVSAVFAVGLTALMLAMGVPGIPGTLIQIWLVIAGIWLAVGRSRVIIGGSDR
ncbi:hypothetical protein BHE97_04130 [Aeromicrobium sp. PE09-221]|uniref:hypothetical protein n=1 Tax=Aeromicrobium sp. PE09-221 TaxID=1898043 RepID=UPI000B703ED1|nr:hypothetical protein [Aeromicrobium sp. PE09-221]OUZ11702.1 hypothetical protein BHE97_04130 [Aeromicrobium sp. PE09-221]